MKTLITTLMWIITSFHILYAQDQTQDFIIDNDKFIYFRDVNGTQDGARLGRHTGNAVRLRYLGNSFMFDALDNEPVLIRNSSDQTKIQFSPNGTSWFDGGILGIGTTSPRSTLDVFGNTGITISDEVGLEFWSQQVVGAGDLHFYDNAVSGTGNEVKVTFQNSTGNVGIGTTSPSSTLHIVGDLNINDKAYFETGKIISSANGTPKVYNRFAQTNVKENIAFTMFGDDATDRISFMTDYGNSGTFTEHLVIVSENGNVGVGVTDPDSKLVVNGKLGVRKSR